MGTPHKTVRGLLAVGLMVGVVSAACGSSSGQGGSNGTGGALPSGLASNLDKLDSYQFKWQDSSDLNTAIADGTAVTQTSGTVINKPVKSYLVDEPGVFQVIVIGSQGWISHDNGATWQPNTTYTSASWALQALLPNPPYGSTFDSDAAGFTVADDEKKNGIDCIHYIPNSDLQAIRDMAWPHAMFKADLWVARDGNYPVSGFYGWSGTPGGQLGSWGYSFDVTNVNSSGNKVTAPTSVMAAPSQ